MTVKTLNTPKHLKTKCQLQLYNFHALPFITMLIKSRRMRQTEHVACIRRWEMYDFSHKLSL